MIRVVFVFAVAVTAVLGGDKEECKKLGMMSTLKCCKQLPAILHKAENFKDCKNMIKPLPNCDADICVAKQVGYADSEDGKFDKKALEIEINKTFEKIPELAEIVVKNCIQEDLSAFGKPDLCELIKFRNCLHMHLVVTCPEWDSAGPCSGIKDLVEKCDIIN